MVKQFVSSCCKSRNKQVRVFGEYFKRNYAARPEQWAIGLRGIFVDTTNMALEAFHKVLKHNAKFMDGKTNQRVDGLLRHLFGYMASMKRRGLMYSASNCETNKNSAINFKNHKAALKTSVSLVTETENGFRVRSFSNENVSYEVNTLSGCGFETKCRQVCRHCSVCFHIYSCSCPDAKSANNRNVSCKHAHLVMM